MKSNLFIQAKKHWVTINLKNGKVLAALFVAAILGLGIFNRIATPDLRAQAQNAKTYALKADAKNNPFQFFTGIEIENSMGEIHVSPDGDITQNGLLVEPGHGYHQDPSAMSKQQACGTNCSVKNSNGTTTTCSSGTCTTCDGYGSCASSSSTSAAGPGGAAPAGAAGAGMSTTPCANTANGCTRTNSDGSTTTCQGNGTCRTCGAGGACTDVFQTNPVSAPPPGTAAQSGANPPAAQSSNLGTAPACANSAAGCTFAYGPNTAFCVNGHCNICTSSGSCTEGNFSNLTPNNNAPGPGGQTYAPPVISNPYAQADTQLGGVQVVTNAPIVFNGTTIPAGTTIVKFPDGSIRVLQDVKAPDGHTIPAGAIMTNSGQLAPNPYGQADTAQGGVQSVTNAPIVFNGTTIPAGTTIVKFPDGSIRVLQDVKAPDGHTIPAGAIMTNSGQLPAGESTPPQVRILQVEGYTPTIGQPGYIAPAACHGIATCSLDSSGVPQLVNPNLPEGDQNKYLSCGDDCEEVANTIGIQLNSGVVNLQGEHIPLPAGTHISPDGRSLVINSNSSLPLDTAVPPGSTIDQEGNIKDPSGNIVGHFQGVDSQGNIVPLPEGIQLSPDGSSLIIPGSGAIPLQAFEPDPETGGIKNKESIKVGNRILNPGDLVINSSSHGSVSPHDLPQGNHFVENTPAIDTGNGVIPAEANISVTNDGYTAHNSFEFRKPDGSTVHVQPGDTITPQGEVIHANSTSAGSPETPPATTSSIPGVTENADNSITVGGKTYKEGEYTRGPNGEITLDDGTIINTDGTVTHPSTPAAPFPVAHDETLSNDTTIGQYTIPAGTHVRIDGKFITLLEPATVNGRPYPSGTIFSDNHVPVPPLPHAISGVTTNTDGSITYRGHTYTSSQWTPVDEGVKIPEGLIKTNGELVSETLTPTITQTPIPSTNIAVSLRLPGIGIGTDANNTPKNVSSDTTLALYKGGKLFKTATSSVPYKEGVFSGNITLQDVPSGTYDLYIKVDNTLYKKIGSKVALVAGTDKTISQVADLVSGDLNQDNRIDLVDYNIFTPCQGNRLCKNKDLADLNSDGKVDEIDLNIMLRGLSVQTGDTPE